MPGLYGVSMSYNSGSKYSQTDFICQFEAGVRGYYYPDGVVEKNEWLSAFIVDNRGRKVGHCELRPRLIGERVYIASLFPRKPVVDYEVPLEFQDQIRAMSLVQVNGQKNIFIEFVDKYGEIVRDKLHYKISGFASFACVSPSGQLTIFQIPDDLNQTASMTIYDAKSWTTGHVTSQKIALKRSAVPVFNAILKPSRKY